MTMPCISPATAYAGQCLICHGDMLLGACVCGGDPRWGQRDPGKDARIVDAADIPQPTYRHIWDAYVAGAEALRHHPEASDPLIRRSADAYCKLVLARLQEEARA